MNISSSSSQPARLLLFTCTTLASFFLLLEPVAAQNTTRSTRISRVEAGTMHCTENDAFNEDNTLWNFNPISKVYCDPIHYSLFLGSKSALNLENTTQTISALTLEDGSKVINGTFIISEESPFLPQMVTDYRVQDYLAFYKITSQEGTFDLGASTLLVPFLHFKNGAKIEQGILIIDNKSNTNYGEIDESK